MIVNTRWLLDYLDPHPTLPVLLTTLPRVGLDIEAVHVLSRELENIRIGFIRSKRPLDGTTDKWVLEVEVAPGETRQIVCASAHPVEVGWGVPVALAGTELPSGGTIQEDTFHGVLSQGMICLDGEMGLVARGSGLQVFHDEALLGQRLPDVTHIEEALVHVKVYPNRPDCLGLVGIAREIAAMLDLKLVLPKVNVLETSTAAVPVEIESAALCSRYTCRVVNGVKIGPSPAWLASRLLSSGSRPINNVVDITNFVMKEFGHPLHAFDLRRVKQKVVVRRFTKGESLRLLDGRVVGESGDAAPLAICDAHGPMALAGIMGGEGSGIADSTTDVLLESAHFEPTGIRASGRRLGVASDSSYRFERGMDPNETLEAARERAASLMFEIAAANSAGPVTDTYPVPVQKPVFSLPAGTVTGYLGVNVTADQVKSSLMKLGYECSDDLRHIEAPTRRVDVNDSVVLIEDVARVIGYEAIKPAPSPETPSAGSTTALDVARQTARGLLVGDGFLELRGVPLEPLEGEARFAQLEGASITLANPLNADLARVRRSLIPFLVKTAVYNGSRRAATFRYFEIDKIFARQKGEPVEQWSLGMLLGGALNDSDWSTRRETDFFDLKGSVESLLEGLRAPRATFASVAAVEGFQRETTAAIVINGETVGLIGQVDPEYLASERIHQAVFAAELFLGKLLPMMRATPAFEALPRFPGVYRDLSFVVAKSVPYAAMEMAIRAAAGPNLEAVDCIDVFAGKGIAKESRSIAVSMAFRAADRTLASEEVNAAIEQIIAKLATEFKADLRA
ncbi:MAG: phenylalanine--tRNA ligase subunit beta [Bryobacteraceae bacterium]